MPRRTKSTFVLAIAFFFGITTNSFSENKSLGEEILVLTDKIILSKTPTEKYAIGERLYYFINSIERLILDKLQPSTIDAIAGLLQEDDYAAQTWSAASLDRIGPSAKRAIPALEAALEEL